MAKTKTKQPKPAFRINTPFIAGFLIGIVFVSIGAFSYVKVYRSGTVPDNLMDFDATVPGQVDSYLTCRSKCIGTSDRCQAKCPDIKCKDDCVKTGRTCITECHKTFPR